MMGRFTCHCLNVTLNCISSSSFQPIDVQKLALPPTVLKDHFFNNEIAEVVLETSGVTSALHNLLKTRPIGKLTITSCLCCKLDTHAVYENQDRALVNLALISDPEKIRVMKESPDYSELFKLILPVVPNTPQQSIYELKQQTKALHLDAVIQTIRQQSTIFLCDEQKEMEERIRLFTEQQYSEYNALQKTVLDQRQAVINLIYAAHSTIESPPMRLPVSLASFPSPPTSPDNSENTPSGEYSYYKADNQKEVPKTAIEVSTSQLAANIIKSSNIHTNTRSSVAYHQAHDTMFDMDGLEEDPAPFPLSDDEVDTDDSTDDLMRLKDIKDQQHRLTYATSLPISVPLWPSFNRTDQSDDSDKSSNPDPQQMAASIQALALSIRDDKEMFGDLPRRRLNTGDLLRSRPI